MKRLLLLLLLLAGCQTVPESERIAYRAVPAEENARALKAIVQCLTQPDCPGLLGERLECGPFLWRQLSATGVGTATAYQLPQDSGPASWEGRRAEGADEVRTLWRAFAATIPLDSLQKFRALNKDEIRIYSTLVPGEIREPVFIALGGGHKILMQIAGGKLTFIDDFRDVVIRD